MAKLQPFVVCAISGIELLEKEELSSLVVFSNGMPFLAPPERIVGLARPFVVIAESRREAQEIVLARYHNKGLPVRLVQVLGGSFQQTRPDLAPAVPGVLVRRMLRALEPALGLTEEEGQQPGDVYSLLTEKYMLPWQPGGTSDSGRLPPPKLGEGDSSE